MKIKRIIAIILMALAVMISLLFLREPVLKLKHTSLTLEYGTQYDFNFEHLIDIDKLSSKDIKALKKDLYISSDCLYEGDLLAVGEYHIVCRYHYQSVEMTLKVQDTTPPQWKRIDEVIVEQDSEVDFTQYIEVDDLSSVSLSFNDDGYDCHIPGRYVIQVIATDIYNNVSQNEMYITVKEKYQEPDLPTASPKTSTHVQRQEATLQEPTDSNIPENNQTNQSDPGKEVIKTLYWAECKTCHYRCTSYESLEKVKTEINDHLDNHYQCVGYFYGFDEES